MTIALAISHFVNHIIVTHKFISTSSSFVISRTMFVQFCVGAFILRIYFYAISHFIVYTVDWWYWFCTSVLCLSSVILLVDDLILPLIHRPWCQILIEPPLLLSRAHPIPHLLIDFFCNLPLPSSCLVVVVRGVSVILLCPQCFQFGGSHC